MEREIRGLRPGSTFGFGGIGGLDSNGFAPNDSATPGLTTVSAAAVSDIGGRIEAKLGGWLKTLPSGGRGDSGLRGPFVICPSAGLKGPGRGLACVLDAPVFVELSFSARGVPWTRVRLAALARELAVGAINVEDSRDLAMLPGALAWLFAAAPLILVRVPRDETMDMLPDVLAFTPSKDVPVIGTFLLWLPLAPVVADGKRGIGDREVREDVGGASVAREVVLGVVGCPEAVPPEGTRFAGGTAVTDPKTNGSFVTRERADALCGFGAGEKMSTGSNEDFSVDLGVASVLGRPSLADRLFGVDSGILGGGPNPPAMSISMSEQSFRSGCLVSC